MSTSIFYVIFLFSPIFAKVLPPKYRLQNNAIPKSYNIKLHPFFQNDSFSGDVKIFVDVQHPILNLTLQSKNLIIEQLHLDNNECKFELLEEYDLLNIFYQNESYIQPGQHYVYIKFRGNFSSKREGIYKSQNFISGENYDTITTMFSASSARMVFPCFDEPEYRANFKVRLIKPDDSYVALSNMPEISSYPTKEGIAVDFQTSVKMPTYLLAFIITKHKCNQVNYINSDGALIPIRYFSHPKDLNQTRQLVEIAKASLNFLRAYTKIDYVLPKLDLVEVDMTSDGMEHWGLITILQNISTPAIKPVASPKIERIGDVYLLIAHEVAHQWFGNLVTHKWYNDLWLTEGFADLMDFKVIDSIYPDWELLSAQTVLRHIQVMKSEVQNLTRPVIFFPDNDWDIEKQFEDLVYSKGSAILSMLENAIGKNCFRHAVRQYLKKFSFKSVTTNDFIEVVENLAPDVNVRGFLESWLFQSEYPFFKVKEDLEYVIIQQFRFDHSNYGKNWTTPISFTTNCQSKELIWYEDDAVSVKIKKCSNFKWIKLNDAGVGMFRVFYSEQLYQKLLKNFAELTVANQANLIEETTHLSKLNIIPCSIPLQLINKIGPNFHYLNVMVSLSTFKDLWVFRFTREKTFEKLKDYFLSIFYDFYKKLTWNVSQNESFGNRLIRAELIKSMCIEGLFYEICNPDVKKINSTPVHEDVLMFYNIIKYMNSTKIVERQKIKKEENIEYLNSCAQWIENNNK